MVLMNRSKSIDEYCKQREIGDPTPIVLSGVCALCSGKTLNATIFCSYGGFWISFGFIYLPSSGIIDSFKNDQVMLRNAIGIYLTVWTFVTLLLLIASLRTTILDILTLSLVLIVFIFLDIANFTGQDFFSRIGGYVGVLASFTAWYTAMAQLLTKETSYFILPTFPVANNKN
ncbi:26089_t:CDS:2, partial [Gigaspora rosea]